jgi:DNA-binding NarL/FixJ family response regulator
MKILHIDDHVLFMEGMNYALQALAADVTVVQATHCREALELAAGQADFDLALLDLHMPGMHGHACLKAFCDAHPRLPVVVLSASEEVSDVRLALDQGASGFIPKSSPTLVMISALRLVLAGGIYIPPLMLAVIASSHYVADKPHAAIAPNSSGHKLTERQRDVLMLLAQGKVNKVIARELGIGEGTVKIHLASIYGALNVGNRMEAVLAAQQMGLVADIV